MIPDACSRIIKHTLPIETAKRDGDEENASKGRLEVMKTIPCSFSFSLSSLSFVASLLWSPPPPFPSCVSFPSFPSSPSSLSLETPTMSANTLG